MRLLDLLQPEAILLNIKAKDSTEVIERLGGKLRDLDVVKEDFVAATLEREQGMPTGLPLNGDVNAALPHVDLEYVKSPAVALATLEQPVEFRQMVETDKTVSVRLVIMLALNEPKAQVEMLGQVSTLLQNTELVEEIMQSTSPDQVLVKLEAI